MWFPWKVLFLKLLFLLQICRPLIAQYIGEIQFHTNELSRPVYVRDFFQYPNPYTHAHVRIVLCTRKFALDQYVLFRKTCACRCKAKFLLETVLQFEAPGKGLLIEFRFVPAGALRPFTETLQNYDNPHNFFAVRVAHGPAKPNNVNSSLSDATELYKYFNGPRRDYVAIKFAEDPLDYHYMGYSETQLTAMKNAWLPLQKHYNLYILLDAYYLATTDESLNIAEIFPRARFALYLDRSQKLPNENIYQLKKKLLPVYEAEGQVLLFLSKHYKDRLSSYLPSVVWEQWRSDVVKGTFLKDVNLHFHEFILSFRQLVGLTAIECDQDKKVFFSVTSWCDDHNEIDLEQLFQFYDDQRMKIFLRYTSSKLFTEIHMKFSKSSPFVVFEATHGPNADSTDVFDDLQTYKRAENVRLVLGFAEKTGESLGYTSEDVIRMVELIDNNFEEKDFGIRFRIDLLGESNKLEVFEPLARRRWIWVMLYQEEPVATVSELQISNAKIQLKAFNRETYLFVSDDLRNKLFLDKEARIPEPPPTLEPPPIPEPPLTLPTSTTRGPTTPWATFAITTGINTPIDMSFRTPESGTRGMRIDGVIIVAVAVVFVLMR